MPASPTKHAKVLILGSGPAGYTAAVTGSTTVRDSAEITWK